MSTLKTANLQHPSAASPAIVLDADGNATVAGMGLVHINTTTFSAVSSVNIDGVFSSSYDSYRLIVSGSQTQAAGSAVRIKLRSGGTSISSNYGFSYINNTTSSSVGGLTAYENWDIGAFGSGNFGQSVIEIGGPFLLGQTTGISTAGNYTGQASLYIRGLHQTDSTSFDGFSTYVQSGTITGTIRVYGYRNEA